MTKKMSIGEENIYRKDSQFLKLFLKHHEQIFAFIVSLVPNFADAEDILQDTAEIMWRKFDEFEAGSNFMGWGINIARNKIMQLRKMKSKNALQFDDEALERIMLFNQEIISNLEERMKALHDCLPKLGQEDIHLIKSRYEQGLSFTVISTKAGVSIHTLYKRMGRIYTMLQNCIRRKLAVWGAA